MARTKKIPRAEPSVVSNLSKIQKRGRAKNAISVSTTKSVAVANGAKSTNRSSSRVRQSVDRFQPLVGTPSSRKSNVAVAVKNATKKQRAKSNVVGSFKNRIVASKPTKKVSAAKKAAGKSPAKKASKRSLKKEPEEERKDEEQKPSPKKKKPAKGALTPRPNVKSYTVDPFFESKEQVPFVSTNNYSKLAIRAVLAKDANLLKRLINDTNAVCTVHMYRSVDQHFDACAYALLNASGVDSIVKLLLDDAKTPKPNRVKPVSSLLVKQQTGAYNFHMLGHAVRPIEMSRGGREGNNAFTKDANEVTSCGNWAAQLWHFLAHNIDFKLIQQLVADGSMTAFQVGQNIFHAVRHGNRKLAGQMMKEYGASYFNEVHQQVLMNDKQPLKPFKPVSAKKKGTFNKDMTPIHCAAINPNAKYLQDLLAVEPDFNHPDQEGWRAIHYAAACDGSEPLSFLLQKGSSPYDMPKRSGTAVHIACECGRAKNVAVLLEFLKKNDPDLAILKTKSRNGFAPLHLAAREGFVDVVKVLRKFGADVELQTSALVKNVNSVMLACQKGHYGMVEHLHTIEEAMLDKKDKLKRTALMHAALNGHAHIVSYLLRAGVNMDLADSSGNTAVHYAAAYGWYFCLKLLVEAGANLSVHNSWQLTPLAVAYMKGHMGLADYLLQQPGIDINCKDDKGMTLVALTISSGIDSSTVEQLDYLINQKHADPTLTDTFNNNPLHYLAIVDVNLSKRQDQSVDQYEDERTKLVLEVAKILVKAGCSPTVVNDQNQTPLSTAVKSNKLELALYFMESADNVSFASSLNKLEQSALALAKSAGGVETVLHDLSKNSGNARSSVVFDALLKLNGPVVKSLLKIVDNDGATPFLRACLTYANLQLVEEQQSCRNLIQKLLDSSPDIIEQTKTKVIPATSVDLPVEQTQEEDEEKEDEEEEKEDAEEEGKENEVKASSEKSDFDGAVDGDLFATKKFDGSTNETAFHLVLNLANEVFDKQVVAANKRPLLTLLLHCLQNRQKSITATTNPLEFKDYLNRTPLYRAVVDRDSESAKLLIAAGSNVNFVFVKPKQNDSQTDQQDDKSKKKKETPTNITVLMAAVINKMRDVVSSLLSNKASVHATDSLQNTALHYACHDQSSAMSEIASVLIESGANVEARNARLRTPLHLICNADTGVTDVSTETLEYLLYRNADPFAKDCRGRLPLHYAFVKIGDHKNSQPIDPVALVTVLLRYVQAKPSSLNVADAFRHTPLHYAARRGANICCISLLRHAEVELNPKNDHGNTPLGLAVYFNHKSCALTLLQANADILSPLKIVNEKYTDLVDYQKKTAWKWSPTKPQYVPTKILSIPSAAIKNEWQGVVYVIMEMLGKQKDSSLKSLAEAALEHRKYNFVLTLLRSAKNDARFIMKSSNSWLSMNVTDKNLLHLLADTADDAVEPELQVKVAEMLKTLGVDMDEHKPVEGPYHPAFYAAKHRNFNLLKFFDDASKHTFDHFMPTSDGHTVFTMLLHKTGKWTDDKMDWLEKFVAKHRLSLNLLTKYATPRDYTNSLKGLEWDSGPVEQITPLIRVIHAHDFQLAKLLLKLGADVNFADLDGRTPLMHAVRINDEYLTYLLLDHSYELPKGAITVGDEEEHEDTTDDNESDAEDETDQDDENSSGDESDSGVRVSTGGKAPRKPIRAFNTKGLQILQSQHSGQSENLHKAVGDKNRNKSDDYFKKSSRIDLSRKDNFGRTVVHHLVQPLSYGSWENVRLLRTLIKNGAPANQKDSNGDTPYDVARRTGQKAMCAELENLLQLAPREVEYDRPEVTDDVGQKLGQFSTDVAGDGAKYLEERRKAKTVSNAADNVETETKRKWRPHRLSGYSDIGELVADDSNPNVATRPYSVLLSKAEFTGPYGYYNFYRLQLMKRKGADLYVVFTNWGRIGDEGQYQKTPFGSLAEATKEFKSIFRSKTGNDWSSVLDSSFTEMPKKYRLLESDAEKDEENSRLVDVDIELETNLKSKLPENLQSLMSDFTNVHTLKKASGKSFANQMRFQYPLIVTSLTRDHLMKTKECLINIGKAVSELSKIRNQPIVKYDSDLTKTTSKKYEEIFRLSLEFYNLLPMKGFEKSDLKIIDNVQTLRDYHGIVDGLLDYERANATLCAAAYRRSVAHPYDYVYRSLECRIHLLSPDSHETQYVLHYINNTAPNVDVKSIYKIQGEKQTASFDPNRLANHKLLWHGTKTANLISILSLGLLAAPPQALFTGSLFGKGIYLADTFSKSEGYCVPGPSGLSYILLCEAALGEIKQVQNFYGEEDVLKGKYDSVKGVGGEHPDERFDVTLPTGATIPLGQLITTKPTKQCSWFNLSYNEYICYNPDQVVVRYLVAFK